MPSPTAELKFLIWPNCMLIDQYLVLVWVDLHVFLAILSAIFGLNIFWGGSTPTPTPELKFLIWPSCGPDQYKFILWYKLSFLWKFQPDWSTLRGGLNWSGMLWHPRYLHSLNLYFGLDINFWRNTLLKFMQVATPVGDNMVYQHNSALIEKILAYPGTANRRLYFHLPGPHITPMTPLVHQI